MRGSPPGRSSSGDSSRRSPRGRRVKFNLSLDDSIQREIRSFGVFDGIENDHSVTNPGGSALNQQHSSRPRNIATAPSSRWHQHQQVSSMSSSSSQSEEDQSRMQQQQQQIDDSAHLSEASYHLGWDRDRGWSRGRTASNESEHSIPLDEFNRPILEDLSDSMLEEVAGFDEFGDYSFECDEINTEKEFFGGEESSSSVSATFDHEGILEPTTLSAVTAPGEKEIADHSQLKHQHSPLIDQEYQARLGTGDQDNHSPVMGSSFWREQRLSPTRSPGTRTLSSTFKMSPLGKSAIAARETILLNEHKKTKGEANELGDNKKQKRESANESQVKAIGDLIQSLRLNSESSDNSSRNSQGSVTTS